MLYVNRHSKLRLAFSWGKVAFAKQMTDGGAPPKDGNNVPFRFKRLLEPHISLASLDSFSQEKPFCI